MALTEDLISDLHQGLATIGKEIDKPDPDASEVTTAAEVPNRFVAGSSPAPGAKLFNMLDGIWVIGAKGVADKNLFSIHILERT